MRTKEKLVILLKALEVENIDKLIVCGVDTFETLGEEIAKRTKQLKAQLNQKTSIIEAMRERTKLQDQEIGVLAKRIEELERKIRKAKSALYKRYKGTDCDARKDSVFKALE